MQHLPTISFPHDLNEFSDIIDVRSPSEFKKDHIPGARNLPVLDDAKREEIGKIYKTNPFEARKLGAAIISAQVSSYIQNQMFDTGPEYKPLLYCWRGGMRSRSFAFILHSIGWKAHVIYGGYRAFRRYLIEDIEAIFTTKQLNIQVLSGLTGVGKTKLLHEIQKQGGQILDLEALANHKGSLLGSSPDSAQPSQKSFETNLWHKMRQLDLSKPIFTEAESNRIGSIHCPPALWRKLHQAKVINVELPIAERVKILLEDYPHFLENTPQLKLLLRRLISLRGHTQIEQWNTLIDKEQWKDFVKTLLETHYDLCYQSPGSEQSNYQPASANISIPDATAQSFTQAAKHAIDLAIN